MYLELRVFYSAWGWRGFRGHLISADVPVSDYGGPGPAGTSWHKRDMDGSLNGRPDGCSRDNCIFAQKKKNISLFLKILEGVKT